MAAADAVAATMPSSTCDRGLWVDCRQPRAASARKAGSGWYAWEGERTLDSLIEPPGDASVGRRAGSEKVLVCIQAGFS